MPPCGAPLCRAPLWLKRQYGIIRAVKTSGVMCESASANRVERLAESLGRTFRSYNASLINYDDLVGVPLPDATRTKLEYLSSPESIWDAEVVPFQQA